MDAPPALHDQDVAAYVASLGLPGIADLHVHFMPERVQAKVWAHFDRLDPPWPIVYRAGEAERLAILAGLGVRHHTALAYAHRPGMAAWLNRHTLSLAAAHPAVVGSFTLYPEPGVDDEVRRALAAGGRVAQGPPPGRQVPRAGPAARPGLGRAGQAARPGGAARRRGAGRLRRRGVLRRRQGRRPARPLPRPGGGHRPSRRPRLRGLPGPGRGRPKAAARHRDGVRRAPGHRRLPARLVERLGTLGDRVLFGSDFPSVSWPFADQLGGLAALGLVEDWLRAVLWHNGARLLGLDGAGAAG